MIGYTVVPRSNAIKKIDFADESGALRRIGSPPSRDVSFERRIELVGASALKPIRMNSPSTSNKEQAFFCFSLHGQVDWLSPHKKQTTGSDLHSKSGKLHGPS